MYPLFHLFSEYVYIHLCAVKEELSCEAFEADGLLHMRETRIDLCVVFLCECINFCMIVFKMPSIVKQQNAENKSPLKIDS